MSYAWVLHGAAALLLVVAGVPRVLRPEGMVSAARELGLTVVGPPAARLLGLAEAAVGAWALLAGGRLAALAVALCYAGFAVVTAVGRARGASSCGCFVGDDAPPSLLHVGVDTVLALAAAVVATGGATGLVGVVGDQGAGTALALLAQAVVDAGLVYLLLARYPVVGVARTAVSTA